MSVTLGQPVVRQEPATSRGAAILVTQFFPPLNMIGSQRAVRIARVLLEAFDRVYVLTLPTGDLPAGLIDRDFGRDVTSNARLHILEVRPWLPGYGNVATPRLVHRMLGASLMRMLCSTGADWVPPVASYLRQIGIKEQDIKVIIASGSPYVPFLPVVRFAEKAQVPCILDYRDLWSQNPRAPYPLLARLAVRHTLERYVNSHSTVITTVSDGCRKSILAVRPQLTVKSLLNTPDADYRRWFNEQPTRAFEPDCLNIVLTGTVYRECTCRLLIRVLRGLDDGVRAKIRLHYFGPSSDLVRGEFSDVELSENLRDHGMVPKHEAASAVKGADLLLSLVFDSSRGKQDSAVLGIMTTKVFDYFLSGKPIFNVSPANADVCEFARQIGYDEFQSFDDSHERELSEAVSAASADLAAFRRRSCSSELPDFSQALQQILRDVCT